ncbi:MAG TPA: SDR family NAD(P)-dependent oxidoreductase [Acidimicrobiales bacterium]|nr:SDR family NAD(P)-dependent oxidoreductase [Acidimicrobiales bacterium]
MENAFGQPQNVVVLGGSSDIARAIVKKLCAARTHSVVLCGRSQELLDAAAAEARDYGATKTDTVIFDAMDTRGAARVVTEAFAKVNDQVDLVIMAVGLLGNQVEMQNSAKDAAAMMSVNVTWPVAALAEVRRRLVDQGRGRILVISSVGAIRVRSSAYLYGGAKAGLDRLCMGMADSLENTGVTMQILRAGVVRTKMTAGLPEVPFTTGPNEVAEYVVRGLATGQRVIWSPPMLRYVFGVLRHLPTPLFRKLVDRERTS